ncbi:MAG: RnfABCDGE type electron transport complex subunit D, partial [Cyclobacteriaceae bacterium]
MKFLRKQFDTLKPHFEKGGKWEKFYYAYEAFDTFAFSPNTVNPDKGSQIRDAVDLKRLMMTVIIAMVPCLLFGIWNVGHQHFLAIGNPGAPLGDKIWIGLIQVLPIVIVSYGVGLGVEFIFSTIRRHPVNEGYLVTGMLIPLVMPPDIPLWQVALATIFAVIIGKEAFGGTGMNVLNVALTARAFLYFAYPSDISGDVWTYFGDASPVAGFS